MSVDAEPTVNPWLQGNFAPVDDELTTRALPVTGEIPAALTGEYLRNGFNPAVTPRPSYHWFDGDGMLHGVRLEGGTASYRNRWVQTKGLQAERRAGHPLFGGMSEFLLPDPDLMAEVGMMKNPANTNIIRHAGRLLALWEAGSPTELDADLVTLGETDFDGALVSAMTAHPKPDPDTGRLCFFGAGPAAPYLHYYELDPAGAVAHHAPIDLPAPVMMHDFVVTERHAVFFDLPAVFDIEGMLNGGPIVQWKPEHGARIGVMPRDGGNADVRWFEVDPFYAYHFLNGWDDGDAVVVDGCRADDLVIGFGDTEGAPPAFPHLHRWRLDLATGAVTEEALDDRSGDFPRINDDLAGRPNRYGYVANAGELTQTGARFEGVVKYDLRDGSSVEHRYGDHHVCGEAVFAPDPGGTAEDDGWLLNFVYDRAEDTSDFVILDARDLTAEPVAVVHLPRRVPFGPHGNWLAD
ncbi:MAG: carotenoid oxygenase family protein [Acidimicrobiales bacterium]|nr:carotenoid oxygenase family protein [Acidimicrobiales bacterium]